MGLTYFGGATLLNYLYNDNDTLGAYDSFLVQLIRTDGNAYDSQSGADSDAAAVTRVNDNWNIGGQFVKNANDLTFPPSNNSNSQLIVGFELYIDGIGQTPELFATGTLNTSITIQQGETPIIYANDLEIEIDINSVYTESFRIGTYNYLFRGLDSLSGVVEYKFVVYNTSAQATPLEFYVARKGTFPDNTNWTIPQIGSGANSYAQARNVNDIVLPLNSQIPSVNIVTNQIRMFYSQGTFPNFTYTYAGLLDLWNLGTNQPFTYTINDGETARFQAGYIRINSK